MLIDSAATATAICASPARTAWWASATAFSPEAQAMLIVCAGTCSGRPARSAIWRPGFGPLPACRQLEATTSSTASGATPARSSAAAIACAPSATTGTARSVPP